MIRVTVTFFAYARDLAGVPSAECELPAGATVSSLMDHLVERHPRLAELRGHARLALNCAYAPVSALLRDGDDVAVIPPVSGG
jgi:molybdopterin synthase catalytic subunit